MSVAFIHRPGRLGLILAVALAIALPVYATVDPADLHPPGEGHTQLLDLEDGSTLNGRIIETKADEVVFESSVGQMTIAINRIKRIREVSLDDIRGGGYWFRNPNRTRMFVGPTARMTPKGTGSLSSVYLFFPSVTYGITDNISMSAGMSLFPGLDIDEQLFYFTPKVGIAAHEKVTFAASAMITVVPEWGVEDAEDEFETEVDEPQVVGIVFGVGTYGTEDKSITFGLGYGYADEDFADKPAVILGGEYRFARRVSFVSENWILPGVEPPMISYGVRLFGEGLAVDMAFVNVASDEAIFPGLPYVGFTWNF